MLALAETSGPLRSVFEQPRPALLHVLAALVCHDGIAMLSGEMPPPESVHAVSEAHAPPAPVVVRSVPPTATTNAASAGHASLEADHVLESPEAAKKFWPCAAIVSQ